MDLQKFPPSSVNNSRSIIRSLVSRMNTSPSERLGNKIEDIVGEGYDWSDKDADLFENRKNLFD